jgi:TonB-linked SusC/RagA family outer membrane protein
MKKKWNRWFFPFGRGVSKINKIMRLIVIMTIACYFQATAGSYSQSKQIDFKLKNVSLVDAFDKVRSELDIDIYFQTENIPASKKVSVEIVNASLVELFDKLLEGTDLTFKIIDDNVVVLPTEVKQVQTIQNQELMVKGKVVDHTGDPLPGVNVYQASNPQNGVITGVDGSYSITLDNASEVLVFSFIGFEDQQLNVAGRTEINVTLVEENLGLDEVVVIGYGTNTKKSIVSSISQVNVDEIENVPITNITQGLAGRSPGLVIKANGGGVGKRSTITIRGGATPLVVIDGVIRSYDDFVNILPEDIEDFTILKDASATAVYGSRAANGIIQITTKAGKQKKNGQPSFEYSAGFNWATPHVFPKKLDSYNRAFHINEANRFAGLPPNYSDEILQKYKDQSDPWNYPNVDHQSEVLKNYAPEQKHNLRVQGGNEQNKYFISLGHVDQGSLYKSNAHWLKRTNFRLNQSSTIEKIGLTTKVQLDGYIQKTEHPYSSSASGYWHIFGHIQNKKPWELARNKHGLVYNIGDNPLREISEDNGYLRNGDKVMNGLLALDWKVPGIEGLSLKTTGNYNYRQQDGKNWRDEAPMYDLESTEAAPNPNKPQLTNSTDIGYRWTMQHFIDYNRSFNLHGLNALFGYEYTYGFNSYNWLSRDSYLFPIDQINPGPVSTSKNGGYEAESGRAGYIGQLKYNYATKYFVEGSFRYDGSDNFPEDKRWGLFFSGSLGWSVADEEFFKPLVEKDIFNTFKLRASYGEVGLDNWSSPYNIDRFAYMSSYSFHERSYVINGTIVPGFSEGALPSPDLTWFTSTQMNAGIDFSSLNSRLYGSLDYFFYKTVGFLYAPPALDVGYTDPLGTGLPKVSTDGEHRRAGWELQLGWKDRIGSIQYEVGGNYTHFDQLWANNPSESLEAIKNPYLRVTQQTGYYGTGYKSLGYYQGTQDIMNSPKRISSFDLTRGDIKYNDFNGDGVLDGQDFVRMGKSSFPRGNYGVYLNLKYKGLFVNTLFQGSTSFHMYLGSTIRMNDAQSGSTPVYDFQTDYWTVDNTEAKFPRLAPNSGLNGNNNNVTSDFWLINGAYIRLKDIKIGYDLKQWEWFEDHTDFISRCEIVASGQNLFTISEAKKYGMDPENADTNNYAYPLERVLSLSFNIGF